MKYSGQISVAKGWAMEEVVEWGMVLPVQGHRHRTGAQSAHFRVGIHKQITTEADYIGIWAGLRGMKEQTFAVLMKHGAYGQIQKLPGGCFTLYSKPYIQHIHSELNFLSLVHGISMETLQQPQHSLLHYNVHGESLYWGDRLLHQMGFQTQER